jgi:phosphoribosylformylglycinamidine (FGAM) synthase PurS component
MVVNSKTKHDAEAIVKKMCQDLRIFNPVVSNCTVKAAAGKS